MKLKLVLPAIYCAIALVAWLDFVRPPPDGLANIGLMLVVLPITILDIALRPASAPESSLFMPDQLGYYWDHAVFFLISVSLIACVLWWLGRLLDKRRTRSSDGGANP